MVLWVTVAFLLVEAVWPFCSDLRDQLKHILPQNCCSLNILFFLRILSKPQRRLCGKKQISSVWNTQTCLTPTTATFKVFKVNFPMLSLNFSKPSYLNALTWKFPKPAGEVGFYALLLLPFRKSNYIEQGSRSHHPSDPDNGEEASKTLILSKGLFESKPPSLHNEPQRKNPNAGHKTPRKNKIQIFNPRHRSRH